MHSLETEIAALRTEIALARPSRQARSIEHWDEALAAFSDRLRLGDEPESLVRYAMETIGAELRAGRVGYAEISDDGLTATVRNDWTAPGFASAAGISTTEGYGLYFQQLRRGRSLVVGDVQNDPRSLGAAILLESLAIRALVNLPVIQSGRLAGVLFVHDAQPREWMPDEIAFARDALERLRSAIERRHAEQKLEELAWSLEQKVQERSQALRDSEDFTRLALRATGGVGVWTYVMATDLFVCDAQISDLYGIDPVVAARGIGRPAFLANVHPDDVPRLRATMSGGLARSGDLELEYRIRHPNGSVRWVLSRGHTYFDDYGHPVRRTGVGIETTSHRQMEEQLQQAQKMESLGQLTGGIAHDFNNLLQGIVLPLQLMQKRLAQQRFQGLENYIDAGLSAARRAAGLTQRLLAFARRQPLDSRTADLAVSLAGLEPMLRNTCGENIRLDMRVAGLWPVVTDVNQFESAVLNLVINARDAMPAGGAMEVSAGNVLVGSDEKGPLAGLKPGDYVQVTVSDTGTGMPADVVERAFDPFFTTKPIGQGTGLGLSMVYGYTRQSGGLAVIDSRAGEGTRIHLYFPRGESSESPVGADVPKTLPRPASHKRVLVVEDDETVRRFAVELLRDDGCLVREADSGTAAMRLLEVERDFDLLLTDVGLPGPNGRQVADLARENIPGIKIILMTGYAEQAAHKNSFIDPDMELIVKPFDAAALLARTRKALAG